MDTVAQILIIPDISWNWECYNKTGQARGEKARKNGQNIFSHCLMIYASDLAIL